MKNSLHILYVTTECDFDCPYCFERKRKNSFTLKEDDVEKVLSEIIYNDDPDEVSFFCIFGGEPLLRYDIIEKIYINAYKLKHNVCFHITTNGYRFLDNKFLFRYITNPFVKKGMVSTCISYDGIGHSLRTKKGKDTSEDIIKVLKKFKHLKLKYQISYTVTSKNYKNIFDDVNKIQDEFQPERIVLSYNVDDTNPYFITFKERDSIIENADKFKGKVCYDDCYKCRKCDIRPDTKFYSNKLIKTQQAYEEKYIFDEFD